MAYDIDAVVSPANTKGIMNGGFDAVLRRFFGTIIEVRARQYLEKHPLDVGQAAARGENIADRQDVVRTMRSSSGFGKQQAAV